MSKMTLSTVQWDDGRREEMLLPENSPGPDLLESLAETLYPWNGWHEGAGNPDFKFHDIVKLLGKTLKDKVCGRYPENLNP